MDPEIDDEAAETAPPRPSYPIFDMDDSETVVGHTTDPIAAAHWDERLWK